MSLIRVKRGKKYVGSACVVHESNRCIVLEIDMRLKRADVLAICNGTEKAGKWISAPCLLFCSSEESYFGGKKINTAEGEIEFPTMTGWLLYTAHRIGRYTIAAVFLSGTR
jgi:hypothetical protein